MRRLDAIGITLGVFAAGGIVYLVLQGAGIDAIAAGIWTQALLVGGLVGWLLTYLFRVANRKMTYNQQLENYRQAVLQKRWEELPPEEKERLQAELEAAEDLEPSDRK